MIIPQCNCRRSLPADAQAIAVAGRQSARTGRALQRQMVDTGYWILDAGYWILDAGYWMLDKQLTT